MSVKDREDLIKRMALNGFILDNGHFHRHIYTGRKLYSDIIKFEDAPKWIASLYSDENK
jgi:hypothetical protein